MTSSTQEPVYLPQAHLDRILQRLELLEKILRPRNQEAKSRAYEEGGIHENGAWEAAVQDQAVLDHEISFLRSTLLKALPLESLPVQADKVSLGTIVQLIDLKDQENLTLGIIGAVVATDSDDEVEFASVTSPLARTMIGLSVGDTFKLSLHGSERTYKILSIATLNDR